MSKSGSQGPKGVGASSRDVNNYSPPQGPSNINDAKGPGIHGYVYRQGTQGPTSCANDESGRPGIGGKNYGVEGTQEDAGPEERD